MLPGQASGLIATLRELPQAARPWLRPSTRHTATASRCPCGSQRYRPRTCSCAINHPRWLLTALMDAYDTVITAVYEVCRCQHASCSRACFEGALDSNASGAGACCGSVPACTCSMGAVDPRRWRQRSGAPIFASQPLIVRSWWGAALVCPLRGRTCKAATHIRLQERLAWPKPPCRSQRSALNHTSGAGSGPCYTWPRTRSGCKTAATANRACQVGCSLYRQGRGERMSLVRGASAT